MKVIVGEHKCTIDKTPVNELEVNVTKIEFEFDEKIPAGYVKKAFFTQGDISKEVLLVNDECNIPNEVLYQKGQVRLGVIAYEVQDEELIERFNPAPAYFQVWEGSLTEADNTEPITPSDKEQIEQQLTTITNQMNNLDIDAEKEEHVTTITITKKDGTTEEVQVLDGEKGEKGDKGDAGAIKMLIVAELPQTGADDTIYLVPLENPDTQGNNYAEYVYINGAWELLGKIGVQVDLTDYYTKQETYSQQEVNALIPDLTDYVKNTDYAGEDIAGIIGLSSYYGTTKSSNNYIIGVAKNYSTYNSNPNSTIISKGTLENVITGKDLTTKAYVDGLVGDIGTILDSINNEVL